jgi:xanthine/CO dehydrogenase XdhC/CoxF family maturation factor
MKRKPTVIQLIPEGNPRRSVACWKSQKSANCQAATEWQDRTIDMRMKPVLVKQQFSGIYQGCGGRQLQTLHRMYPSKFLCCLGQRTDCDTSAICRLTNERCIRQSIMLVITPAKWGLPKPERRKAMETDPENPAWQRSFRSSPSRVTPCTWRREAVISFQYY